MKLRGKGTISSKYPCSKCGTYFRDVGQELECTCGRSPKLYDLDIYYPPQKKTIHIRFNKRGERLRSYVEAVNTLIEINDRIKNKTFDPALYQRVSRLRFESAITKWWAENKSRYAPSSRPDYKNKIEKLFIPFFRDSDVREITARQINDLYVEHLKDKVSIKTQDNILSILKAFFRYMKRLDGKRGGWWYWW